MSNTIRSIILIIFLLSTCLIGCDQKTPEPQFTEQQAYILAKEYLFNQFGSIEIVADAGIEPLDLGDSYDFLGLSFRFMPDIGRVSVSLKVNKHTKEVTMSSGTRDFNIKGGGSLRNRAFQELRSLKVTSLVDEGKLQKLDIVNLCSICSAQYEKLADAAARLGNWKMQDEYISAGGWWDSQEETIINTEMNGW